MNLKNYTSSTPAIVTISRIEAYLADAGVQGVSKEFHDGQPTALSFHVIVADRTFTIRLPAKVNEVQEYLWREFCTKTRRTQKTKDDFREQAARTAWKIQQDWIQVQMSLIRLKQADFIQVFLAYIMVGKQTFYDQLQQSKFKALPESTE